MKNAGKFEEVEAWQKARELNRLFHQIAITGELGLNSFLFNQMRSTVLAIMVNLAKGYDGGEENRLQLYLDSASGQICAFKALLFAAKDIGLIIQTQFDQLYQLIDAIPITLAEPKQSDQSGTDPKGSRFESRISSFLR